MRAVQLGLVAVVVAAFAGVLGTAGAQDQTATPGVRTLTVNGSGATSVPDGTGAADRDTAYQSALGGAVDAAKTKAVFLAQRSGVTLGAVQNMSEWTDSPDRYCDSYGGGAVPGTAAVSKSGSSAPVARRITVHKKKAKAADETRCYIPAEVSVTYAISG